MSVSGNTVRQKGTLGETVRSIAWVLIIAGLFRSFVVQPFNIPSGSMEPTLLVGDYLFVSKFSYGFSRYSLPFSPPIFSGRIFPSAPQRGDIAVFRPPEHLSSDYIKRIIGLPGDRIQVIDGVVLINGKAAGRERIADFVGEDPCSGRPGPRPVVRVTQWRETLPNGVSRSRVPRAGKYGAGPGRSGGRDCSRRCADGALRTHRACARLSACGRRAAGAFGPGRRFLFAPNAARRAFAG